MAASTKTTSASVSVPAPAAAAAAPNASPARICREPEFWFTLLLVLGIYFARPATLTIRGEESRWANVAREMIESGDWVVPREQGVDFPNRPPLSNWAIACSMLAFGNGEALAVRFPSLLATLLTALVIYGCGRSFLDRFGALVAAVGYATMGQVLQIGRHAESEPLFTLFTAGALLGWLSCYLHNRSPWITWTLGYSLAALAALTKGPQGPIYFVGSTWLFLAIYDRRFLFRRGHLVGMVAFWLIVAAWQVPFYLATDLASTLRIWGGESANRFTQTSLADSLKHAVRFPLEVFNCTLPWSSLALLLMSRRVREQLGAARKPVAFLTLSVVLCLLPLLLAQEARGRYFMPLYPCIALLSGAAVQAALRLERNAAAQRIWRGALRATVLLAVVVTAYVAWQSTPLAAWIPALRYPAASQSWLLVGCTVLAAAGLFVFCRRAIAGGDASRSSRAATHAVCASAIFYGLAFTGFGVNALDSYSYDTAADMRRTVAQLPAGAKLVSFDLVNHLFAYHLANVDERRVELVATPTPAAAAAADWDYFCFNVSDIDRIVLPLPFAWEQVDVVTVDRNRYDRPRSFVVVGRKLPAATAAASEIDNPNPVSPTVKPLPLEAGLPAGKRS